ncbi:MAG: uncharacterized protein KVP18_001782 [Porospora cf. gigantea A]|uniref:uncharacterized protein n=1 Tax=Porospora cf. gigantea A TaxID=2853593 RepID=UPI003559B38D|nr:MAG: hypothetical protein KVP18_001782 [Porospora cf. gigantea A]
MYAYCVALFAGVIDGWPIGFDRSPDTMPTLKLTLDPPRRFLPQVVAAIEAQEKTRIENQQALWEQFEKEFNMQLVRGEREITKEIDDLFTSATSDLAMSNAVKGSFREKKAKSNRMQQMQTPTRVNGPFFSSFLQSQGIVGNILKKVGSMNNPQIAVEMLDVMQPDAKVERKMQQIEQNYNDQENKFFAQAKRELGEIVDISKLVVRKRLNSALTSFLTDTTSLSSQVRRKTSRKYGRAGKFLQKKTDFTSFLQGGLLNAPQVNVKVASSDLPYPTVVRLFEEQQQRRIETRKLLNAKVLQYHLKLMGALREIVKDSVHRHVSQALGSAGMTAESIRNALIPLQLK